MGISCSETKDKYTDNSNKINDKNNKETLEIKKVKNKNEDKNININKIKKTKNINNELDEQEPCFLSISRSICKIKASVELGLGFLLKYFIDDKYFYFLISNENVIKKEMIDKNEIIEILFDYDFKNIKIKLDKSERYIKIFKDKEINIIIIEIISKDDIDKAYFLLPYLENINTNNLINKDIYIPQYSLNKRLKSTKGIIKNITSNEIIHKTKMGKDSSGSPIFLKDSITIIGIHNKSNNKDNYGYLI